MKCPDCRRAITENASFCGLCGFNFSADFQAKLTAYFELKEDVSKLRSIARNELSAGIERLSAKIEKYYSAEEELSAPAPAPVRTEAARPVVTVSAPPPPPPPTKEDKQRADLNFETAMGQKWLLIIGVVATVFGVGYFLKYSFDQGWVGPAGRVAMAYLWGAVFLFGGNLFRKRQNMENFGLYLSGGGFTSPRSRLSSSITS